MANLADIKPAVNVYAITPHATNEITPLPKSVRINGGGTLVFRTVEGTADVTINVVSGEQLDYRIQYIRATSTATGITGAV